MQETAPCAQPSLTVKRRVVKISLQIVQVNNLNNFSAHKLDWRTNLKNAWPPEVAEWNRMQEIELYDFNFVKKKKITEETEDLYQSDEQGKCWYKKLFLYTFHIVYKIERPTTSSIPWLWDSNEIKVSRFGSFVEILIYELY